MQLNNFISGCSEMSGYKACEVARNGAYLQHVAVTNNKHNAVDGHF